MEQKIEWISEAFSMQPNRITTIKPFDGFGIGVDEIKLEQKRFNMDYIESMGKFKYIPYYFCYKDGKLVSEWRADTMNVGYKYE